VSGSGPPAWRLIKDAPLAARNSFRVPARAGRLVELADAGALDEVLGTIVGRDPLLVLGGGSNILFTRDWPGSVLAMSTRGIEPVDETADGLIVRVAAGENWHGFVRWSLEHGTTGLENLALIPGSVGAAPIQNIGAYGVEVDEFVQAVHAFDRERGGAVVLARDACAFGYRDSRFRRAPGRYIVTAVDFRLPRQRALVLDYAGVREELATMGVAHPDASSVFEAVVRLRMRKLPDPAVIGNAGSFFKNPVVDAAQARALATDHPGLPQWPMVDGTIKLSAAWLVESLGFNGLRDNDAGVSSRHALVLVNHGGASGAAIFAIAERIGNAVQGHYGVRLEPEPVVI
jgi:UDP-N-acetylmuramate dehydrogenase